MSIAGKVSEAQVMNSWDEDTEIRRVNAWRATERERMLREAHQREDTIGNLTGILVVVLVGFVLYVLFATTGRH